MIKKKKERMKSGHKKMNTNDFAWRQIETMPMNEKLKEKSNAEKNFGRFYMLVFMGKVFGLNSFEFSLEMMRKMKFSVGEKKFVSNDETNHEKQNNKVSRTF